ncbi:MAG: DNA mismatch repair protein MutS [Holosporales bacterium]|jgi:DNA mismatch repair protein MutS|nr:DNA mismatch repair protein MutS [Holosporales bacterium]
MNDLPLSPTMQQYVAIKKEHPDSLLFYRLGDFFEMFFDDAVTASRELDIALTTRGKQGGQDVPMCGVPIHAYELYLAKLIQKGYRVVICDQIETPEEAKKRGAKGPLARDITRIVTSGTITEEGMLPCENNYIVAAYLSPKGVIGIAVADVSTGFLGLEETSQKELSDVLARWTPSEIVVSDDMFNAMQTTLEPWRKKLTILPTAKFNSVNAAYLLQSVYNVQTLDIFGNISSAELQTAGVLIDYIMSTQCCRDVSLSAPQLINSDEYLSIDMATRRNLELTVSASEQKNSSLVGTLNNTATASGRRLLIKWVSAPLLNIAKIEDRLNDVEFFVKNTQVRRNTREFLKNLPDVERILSRMALKRATPRDIGSLLLALEKCRQISDEFRQWGPKPLAQAFGDGMVPSANASAAWDEIVSPTDASCPVLCIQRLWQHAATVAGLKGELERAFKKDLPLLTKDGEFIEHGYDPQLDEFRDLRDHASDNLQHLQNQYVQQTGIHNLKIRSNNVWGIYIEVSTSQVPKVPFDFIHKQTLTNCTRYTTNELTNLEQRINQAETSYLKREVEILEMFVRQILSMRDDIIAISEILAYIDVVASGAELAVTNKYVRPTFSDKPELSIVGGRHPVVEQSFRNKDEHFSTNDCELNRDCRRFLLVTGPNMAGKSTYLRQNALIVIMAQIGYFVPAEKAHIGIVDKIFSRIGASDDLASGRSTFMVEMIETAAILHQATNKSLVILDEIGRGTATYDGLSIAWSVSEYLYQMIQCRTLFATHYHELTKLSETFEGVVPVTAATREWEDKIIFLHKIVDGCARKSYGIHVAQLAGLPQKVILRATELLTSFEKEINIQHKNEKVIQQHMNKYQKDLF